MSPFTFNIGWTLDFSPASVEVYKVEPVFEFGGENVATQKQHVDRCVCNGFESESYHKSQLEPTLGTNDLKTNISIKVKE